MTLSSEQLAIAHAPTAPLCVIACAGSGKTLTAVQRLIQLRRVTEGTRGRIALLSFSNVAIESFASALHTALAKEPITQHTHRICVDTLDAFLVSHVLRPHGRLVMRCPGSPFLLQGSEAFLRNKNFWFWAQPQSGKSFPVSHSDIERVCARLDGATPAFSLQSPGGQVPLSNGPQVAARLAALGGYTHSLGQYWSYTTLLKVPFVLRALARRYPHILIDEAQDVGSLHRAILELLVAAGVHVTLIGDPRQAIYEFAGADGEYLRRYGARPNVVSYPLSTNYRSAPSVLEVANRMSASSDSPCSTNRDEAHGAFLVRYREPDISLLVSSFREAVSGAGLALGRSAVVCRARTLVEKLQGSGTTIGQGIVRDLARAAVLRDAGKDYKRAFDAVARATLDLLDTPHEVPASLTRPDADPKIKALSRDLWRFARDPKSGLPAASLRAKSEWHPLLLQRMTSLLQELSKRYGYGIAPNLSSRITRKALVVPAAPTPSSAPRCLMAA